MIFYLSILLLIITLLYVCLAIPYLVKLYTVKSTNDLEKYPEVAVILAVRGSDPHLYNCIKGLISQNYEKYKIYIIIDHEKDPAWTVINKIIRNEDSSKLEIATLSKPSESCSLKCASQVQVIEKIRHKYEIFAFIDADTVPHKFWLKSLVIPLDNPKVGATTGNRWYMPKNATWGALVRYVWNPVALVSMQILYIPWGGSMAIKRTVFENTDILDNWQNSLCEDTSVFYFLKKIDLSLVTVSDLILMNYEHCTIRSFINWQVRQLVNNRLHHPLWIHMVTFGLTTVSIVIMNLLSLFIYNIDYLTLTTASIVIFYISQIILVFLFEKGMQNIAKRNNNECDWLNFFTILKIILSIPIAYAVAGFILIKSLMINQVEWRGIKYLLKGKEGVQMIKYAPYNDKTSITTDDSI